MGRFKYVEYEGDDAADVLVSLLMHMEEIRVKQEPEHEKVETRTERVVGFQANPEVGPAGEEDADE